MRFAFPIGLLIIVAAAMAFSGLGLVAQEPGSREEFRKLHAELRERMTEGLDEATEFLEERIAADPKSANLQILRESLASKLSEDEQFDEAYGQVEKLLDFQIQGAAESENQYGIWMTIQSLSHIASQSSKSKPLQAAVNRALEAFVTTQTSDSPVAPMPWSQLTVMKSHFMVEAEEIKEAKSLIDLRLKTLREQCDNEDVSEEIWQARVGMLRALTTDDQRNDSWRDELVQTLVETVGQAIDRFPKSLPIQNAYADVQLLMITRWGQDDPKANNKRIEQATKNLNRFALSNGSVLATLRRIELYKEAMSAVKPVATLVGKPAPEWDIDGWVNGDETTKDALKGKVVLLDFWAMWCGPCIATFPHLREWREEFADDDFEIVGVTKYYNYEWDESKKRASRADEDISGWAERDTLKSFMDHHKLKHPVIVQPDESKMSSNYGVKGIPHVVLVDQNGVVQLVKTGAGKETADAIHAKIKSLLSK